MKESEEEKEDDEMSIRKSWDLESAQMLFSSQNRYGCKWKKYKNIPHDKDDRKQKFAVTLSDLGDNFVARRRINPSGRTSDPLASEWMQESLKATKLSACANESFSDSEAEHLAAIESTPALRAVMQESLRKYEAAKSEAELLLHPDPVVLLSVPSHLPESSDFFPPEWKNKSFKLPSSDPSFTSSYSMNTGLHDEGPQSVPDSFPSLQQPDLPVPANSREEYSSNIVQVDNASDNSLRYPFVSSVSRYCFDNLCVVVQRRKVGNHFTAKAIASKTMKVMRTMSCRESIEESKAREEERRQKARK